MILFAASVQINDVKNNSPIKCYEIYQYVSFKYLHAVHTYLVYIDMCIKSLV